MPQVVGLIKCVAMLAAEVTRSFIFCGFRSLKKIEYFLNFKKSYF